MAALDARHDAKLSTSDIGVILEEILALDVARRLGTLPQLRAQLALGDESLRMAIIDQLEEILLSIDEKFVQDLANHPQVELDTELIISSWSLPHGKGATTLRLRLAQRAFERVRTERVAPPLKIRLSAPLSHAEFPDALPGTVTHAVIVGELTGAIGEIFPLILDAYSHDLREFGAVNVNLLAVHHSWLSEAGKAERAIYYNHSTRTLWETDLQVPLEFQSCQFLCLGRDESRLHAQLATRLGACLLVNAVRVSECCDDKYNTAMTLALAGVRSPKAALLRHDYSPRKIGEQLVAAGLTASQLVVIQPNRGTEGFGVSPLTVNVNEPQSLALFSERVAQLAHACSDDILVRERVECLRWTVGQLGHVTSIRINVCWDGPQYFAESAYLQVAGRSDNVVSSVACGGFVVPLSAGAFEKLNLSLEEIALVENAACEAVKAITASFVGGSQVGLFGVDVLLERSAEGPVAWVLEINPRPAGLSHSELIRTGEPGVSQALFAALLARSRLRPLGMLRPSAKS
jgi:D-alanine-D-alanine ligase-like ATP-grasp enzyme